MSSNKGSVNWLIFCLSSIIHLLFLGTTIYVSVIVSVKRGYSLTTLHVIFYTVGCFFLMTEAVLAVSGEALLLAKVSRSGRVTIHWVLHVLGLGLLAAGLGVIEAAKIQSNAKFYGTQHGQVGLAASILSFVVAIAAIPTVYTKVLPRAVSLASIKLLHIFLGIIAMILLIASQITGLYKGWMPGSDLATELTVAAYIVGGFLLHIKPLYTWSVRVYALFT